MPKFLQVIGAIVLVILGASLAVFTQKASGINATPTETMSYAEFTSVILTALSVILGALTIFLGSIAFVGWSSFESMVQRKANDYLSDRFGTPEGALPSDLSELKETIRREIEIHKTPGAKEQLENVSPFNEDAV